MLLAFRFNYAGHTIKRVYNCYMANFLKHTLLGIPVYTWILQLLYVAVALLILFAFATAHKRTTSEIILFVLGIVIVDIIWRVAIR